MVGPDGRGRTVWTEPVDTADELELVSTQALRVILQSKDKKARKLAKKRLGTLTRAKRKVEELSAVIVESRRAAGH